MRKQTSSPVLKNPFSPRSGTVPPLLLGRSEAIGAIQANLEAPLNSDSGSILFTGLRGIGKTVMLNEAGRLAKERGWLVIDSYLTDSGLIDRINRSLDAATVRNSRVREVGLSVLGTGANLALSKPSVAPGNLHDRFETILEGFDYNGILITVDEVHSTAGQAQRALREFGNEIQLAHRNNLPVMAAVAGLPGGIQALLSDRDESGKRTAATFLRRALLVPLGTIHSDEVWDAYAHAAQVSGRIAGPKVIDTMTQAAHGYPYLFQLIGDRVWRSTKTIIDDAAVRQGIDSALQRLGTGVLDTAISDLSNLDREFLLAMAQDDGPSKSADIAARLGISKQQTSNYQRRLLTAEMIVSPSRGIVDFSLPYLRDRLREQYSANLID